MLSDNEFRKVLEYFDRPWSGYRKIRKGVKKRIRRHMQALSCTSADAYLKILKTHPDQKKTCEKCLVVTISRFFRDRRLWEFLWAQVLPEIVSRFPDGIKIWSAGCACGEEPYSLSIVWDQLSVDTELEILATDVNTSCIDRARAGKYGHGSLKEVAKDLKSKYFKVLRKGRQYEVRSFLKRSIRWKVHDLFDLPPKGPFHLIFLRNNLLTYHQGPVLTAAFQQIMNVLVPKGYLVTGSHENPPTRDTTLVHNDQCSFVYQYTPR